MSWNNGRTNDAEWNDGGNTSGALGAWNDEPKVNGNTDFGADPFGGEMTNGDSHACRICQSTDHLARNCPDAPASSNNCFNCGQPGHNKADCPNPKAERDFTGECRLCKESGHRAADCPTKPASKCTNCKEEGHATKDCTNNRVFDLSSIADATAEVAWDNLQRADAKKDLDEIREAIKVYHKAVPDLTYHQLEEGFRTQNMNTYLIAFEKAELPITHTIINLQGELDKKYQVGFYFSAKPRRANAAQGWPSSPEENLERLKDAGLPYDRGVPKCGRCGELGHTIRGCSEEAMEVERIGVKCVNCDADGHRARDCPEPRKDKFACRNCKQSGHTAAECTEPRSAEGVECKKCNEMGHFAKDCPTGGGGGFGCRNCGQEGHKAAECTEPKNPANYTCRNCDEKGHFTKECPKPKDWGKVKCSNCEQMGHGAKRCPEPPKDEAGNEDFGAADGGAGFDAGGAGQETWNTGGGAEESWNTGGGAEPSWAAAPAATAVQAGGW